MNELPSNSVLMAILVAVIGQVVVQLFTSPRQVIKEFRTAIETLKLADVSHRAAIDNLSNAVGELKAQVSQFGDRVAELNIAVIKTNARRRARDA